MRSLQRKLYLKKNLFGSKDFRLRMKSSTWLGLMLNSSIWVSTWQRMTQITLSFFVISTMPNMRKVINALDL
ncbi:Uncharacterised protein [Enterobacter cloacae]|nr:Uncharacterised protein [Enterobacter cloacae]